MAPELPADPEATAIDGAALLRALHGGAQALGVQRDALNAINVFPVPDGDTGTNMSLTMRAAVDEASTASGAGASTIARAAAQGALMGARGNSGVILSQILAGFAAFDAVVELCDGAALAAALERGRAAAYAVVSAPREGTILTSITAASEAAAAEAAGGATAAGTLAVAARAAQEAADRTPDLLPVLKEAGVVDAGAEGLAVLLDGMMRGLRGEAVARAHDFGAIDASWLSATRRAHEAGDRAGFCTEFVVTGEGLDAAAMRARLGELGDSLLVVGGGELLRVHVHTETPDAALAYARGLGAVSHEKVESMDAQFSSLAARPSLRTGRAAVAVGAGAGIEELFRSLGATVVRGGQTMNPSAGDIREAIIAASGDVVIVLPNNRNVVLAAQMAADAAGASGIDARVLGTRTVPQGVAALVAMNTEEPLDENIAAMQAAAEGVRTGEVTLAARATTVQGVAVAEGQPIALVDGELALAGETVDAVAFACVSAMQAAAGGVRAGAIVTLYYGEGVTAAGADALAARLRAELGCEVEIVAGGQPHYPYLIGVE